MRFIPVILALLMASDAPEPPEGKPFCVEHICDWTKSYYCMCGEANYMEHIPGVGLACRCPK